MNKAWITTACLAVGLIPHVALGQFIGGGIGGTSPSPPLTTIEIDKAVTPDYTPIVVLNAADKKSLASTKIALEQTLPELQLQEVPLSECIQQLRKASGVRISIDERALADASIGTDSLLTAPAEEVTLRTMLDAICEPLGLGWLPGKGGLVITTKEEADTANVTIIYPVADLVCTEAGDDYDSLIETITSCVAPNTWHEGSGPSNRPHSVCCLWRDLSKHQLADARGGTNLTDRLARSKDPTRHSRSAQVSQRFASAQRGLLVCLSIKTATRTEAMELPLANFAVALR